MLLQAFRFEPHFGEAGARVMTQLEIDARRHALAAEYLALEDCRSKRGLEIAHEFGVLAEEEDHLQRKALTISKSATAHRPGAPRPWEAYVVNRHLRDQRARGGNTGVDDGDRR